MSTSEMCRCAAYNMRCWSRSTNHRATALNHATAQLPASVVVLAFSPVIPLQTTVQLHLWNAATCRRGWEGGASLGSRTDSSRNWRTTVTRWRLTSCTITFAAFTKRYEYASDGNRLDRSRLDIRRIDRLSVKVTGRNMQKVLTFGKGNLILKRM
jgi:hypothetical protein